MKHNPMYVQVCIIEEKTTSEMNSGSVAECWFCFILFYLYFICSLKLTQMSRKSIPNVTLVFLCFRLVAP